MRRSTRLIAVTALLLLAACGGSNKSSNGSTGTNGDNGTNASDSSDVADTTGSANDTPLPAQCTQPPYTVRAERDGGIAAGSATFGVVGAAALQIPLVPDKAQTLTYEQSTAMAATTDLIGYGLLFGDEAFGVDDVSLFSGYTPEAAGKSRGVVSIYPSTLTPLAVGDVITPQPMDAVGLFTTLNNIGIDFKTTPDEYMGYANSIRGSVTILGLNDDAICLDVDLAWDASDISTQANGTLTIQGVFTAPLTERTLPLG